MATGLPLSIPENAALVGDVKMHWPILFWSCFSSSLPETAKNSTDAPGLPSGVSDSCSCCSTPASTLQAMTDVANPVADCTAWFTHFLLHAVTITLAAVIGNASANVSLMGIPFSFTMDSQFSTGSVSQPKIRWSLPSRRR